MPIRRYWTSSPNKPHQMTSPPLQKSYCFLSSLETIGLFEWWTGLFLYVYTLLINHSIANHCSHFDYYQQVSRKLEAANPIKEPLKSDLLNGKWELIYTTSRSILQTEVAGYFIMTCFLSYFYSNIHAQSTETQFKWKKNQINETNTF